MACFIEYTWKASFFPCLLSVPNNCIVVGLGVAVKAKTEMFGCFPCLLISSTMASSAVASSSMFGRDNVMVTAAMSLPAVEECASSMMTAKVFFLLLVTFSIANGNFWMVVATILVLLSIALARSVELHLSSITRISPL